MKEEMAEAFSRLSLALGLNQLETEFLKLFVGTITKEKKSTEKEIDAWRERIGEEIFDYLYSLTEKWIAFYFVCLARSEEIKPGEGVSEEDEGIYEEDFREASRTFETVIGNGFHKYQLVLLRIECFRDGKLIELTGIDGEFLNFVREMERRYPDIHFEPSVDFYSSGEDEVGYGFPTDMSAFTTERPLEAKISLLHEIGHCLLEKKRGENLSHLVEVVEADS